MSGNCEGNHALLRRLHIAVVAGDLEAVNRLLRKGASINAIGSRGATALMLACAVRSPGMVAHLLGHGADPNIQAPTLKRTALHWICIEYSDGRDQKTCKKIANLLLRSGANPGLRDATGMTAMALAEMQGEIFPANQPQGLETENSLITNPLNQAGLVTESNEEELEKTKLTQIDLKVIAAWLINEQLPGILAHVKNRKTAACILLRSPWVADYESEFLNALADAVNKVTRTACTEIAIFEKLGQTKESEKIHSVRKTILQSLNGERNVVCTAKHSQVIDASLRELVSLELGLPRFDCGTLVRALTSLLDRKGIPAIAPADWIGLVNPADLLAVARVPTGQIICALETQVRERISSYQPGGGTLSLAQLHGLGEAGAWAKDLVDDMKAAQIGTLSWSDVDRGALLSGAPGVGKTSVARAIASEAGIRLLATTASKWHGSGHLDDVLRAIEADFEQAAELSPCILFIDEIDAIGSRENPGSSKGHDEWITWTVNHLLALMDGFVRSRQIVVIGATNHPDKVDPALRRSGRLDRLIRVPLPGRQALKSIYEHYLSSDRHALNPDELDELVANSIGLTGADIEKHVREARRRARKMQRPISLDDLLQSVFQTPAENYRTPLPQEALQRIAYHEAGHAIMNWLGPARGKNIGRISVIPRSKEMAGSVVFRASEDLAIVTQQHCRHNLAMVLGGRAAEQVHFGAAEASSGASTDIAQAIDIARAMIQGFGLGTNGRLSYLGEAESILSDEIEAELQQALQFAVRSLQEHKPLLDLVAQALIEKSELTGPEFLSLADTYQTEKANHRRWHESRTAP